MTHNQVLLGDCLTFLRDFAAEPAPRFDLVYIDPPFNTGIAHSARQGRGDRAAGAHMYDDCWGGLDAFLEMIEPRLAVVRNVMNARGSLWLHLDFRAVHDCKVRLDRIFGRKHFRGEVIWVPGNGARKRRGPAVTHQTLLIYSKGSEFIWNDDDPSLRESFAATSLKTHFRKIDATGRRYRERTLGGKTYRYYADQGRKLGSVWNDCHAMNANTPLSAETTGYPTQKPEALLERIVRAASTPDSIVLDPMCGSGTTLAVAKRLGRAYLGIDQNPAACAIARERLRDVRFG